MALPGITSSTRGAAARPAEPPPSSPSEDWPVQATDAIVRVVDNVRDKTTGPALNAARWLVYGVALGLLAMPLLVLVLIGVFRLSESFLLQVQSWTGWAWLHDPIGFVYLFYGAIFTLVGLVMWRKADKAAVTPAA